MAKNLDLSKFLSARCGGVVGICEDFSAHIGGVVWDELIADKFSPQNEGKNYLLGGGANVLISPEIRHLSQLSDEYDYIKNLGDGRLEIGAKTPAKKLFLYAKKNDLAGLEFLAHIPGFFGGLVRGNAGLPGAEISTLIEAVYAQKKRLDVEFSYRKSSLAEPISHAVIALQRGFCAAAEQRFLAMRARQPKGPSFGSAFKNPPGDFAARLIDVCGLKGSRVGGAKISEQHANFFINAGGAKFEDFLALLIAVRRRVFDEFGIMLEPEVQVFV